MPFLVGLISAQEVGIALAILELYLPGQRCLCRVDEAKKQVQQRYNAAGPVKNIVDSDLYYGIRMSIDIFLKMAYGRACARLITIPIYYYML